MEVFIIKGLKEEIKEQRLVAKGDPSEVALLRKEYLRIGYELLDITHLCQLKLGDSGWCNDFNEPEERIYHIKLMYRDEVIANFGAKGAEVIDENVHLIFDSGEGDFIVFRKVLI